MSELDRDDNDNFRTRVARLESGAPPNLDPAERFERHYAQLRELAREPRPGLAVLSVAPAGETAAATVLRDDARPAPLVVGRHERCALRLRAPEVSLRAAVFIAPPRGEADGVFTAHDLGGALGLAGAHGEPMAGAFVEQFGAFRVGPYLLFAAATGFGDAWPEDAGEAWERRRAALRAQPLTPRLELVRRASCSPRSRHEEARSSVTSIRGPERAEDGELLADEEPAQAQLVLDAEGRTRRIRVGARALERGVLFGRYSRCEGRLTHGNLSRVHLLVIRYGDEVLAIDTASTNGTRAAPGAQALADVALADEALADEALADEVEVVALADEALADEALADEALADEVEVVALADEALADEALADEALADEVEVVALEGGEHADLAGHARLRFEAL